MSGSEGLGFGVLDLYQVHRVDDLDTFYTTICLECLPSDVSEELVSRWKVVHASRVPDGV